FEPLVGNTPTTSTFRWTWISFCFTFFAFGAVLFISALSERSGCGADGPGAVPLHAADRKPAPDRQVLSCGRRRIAAADPRRLDHGSLLFGPHRLLRYRGRSFPALQLPPRCPCSVADWWIGLSWIRSALFLAPAISGGEPRGQAFLVDMLFWVTLFIVV